VDGETKGLGAFEIEDGFVLRLSLRRQVAGVLASSLRHGWAAVCLHGDSTA
jgi:hypothetical protein